ncbi:MAG: hypothetical protein AB1768_19545 [Pseudomonadota bacterium]|jgi:hypothetical protein
MSSTYSVGKKAAAMAGPDGTIYYALCEQIYESNVFPRTPRWSVHYFGTAEACMDRIISIAMDCDGGMLKEEGGDTTPSAYIKHWREALASPTELSGEWAEASFGRGIYGLGEGSRPQIEAVLAAHGHPGPDGDKVRIGFRHQPALMQAVIDAGAWAWCFLQPEQCSATPAPWAAYKPPLSDGLVPDVTIWSIADRPGLEPEHWIERDGQFRKSGWSYSTVGRLIDMFARRSEREKPGSAEATIRKIRKAMKAARPMSADTSVRIERAKAGDRWDLEKFDQLAAKLSVGAPETVTTTVGAIQRAEAVWEFTSLPDAMVTFSGLPQTPSPAEQPSLPLAA